MNAPNLVCLRIVDDLELEELELALGRSWAFGKGDAEPILIPWQVEMDGVPVGSADGKGHKGGGWLGVESGVGLGRFPGTVGGRYRITATVQQSVPELDGAGTWLEVHADSYRHKNAVVGSMIWGTLALGAFAVGGLLLLLAGLDLLLRWLKRKRPTRAEA
jgi:hypothetical protein